MFSGFMTNAWFVATIVAVTAGVVGFFVVLRGSAFPAHAIPNGAFAGAAGAALLGLNSLLGLGIFAVGTALLIAILGQRGRHDVATALALVVMLALGAAFLSHTTEYSDEIFALLFGQILGVSTTEIPAVLGLAIASVAAVVVLYRPLMLSSAVPDVAEAIGIRTFLVEMSFLVILALATSMTVPVVGALLIFTLMIGPPAAARAVAARPFYAMVLSVVLALVTVWSAIASSYWTNWPIGFFVGVFGAAVYGIARGWSTIFQ